MRQSAHEGRHGASGLAADRGQGGAGASREGPQGRRRRDVLLGGEALQGAGLLVGDGIDQGAEVLGSGDRRRAFDQIAYLRSYAGGMTSRTLREWTKAWRDYAARLA